MVGFRELLGGIFRREGQAGEAPAAVPLAVAGEESAAVPATPPAEAGDMNGEEFRDAIVEQLRGLPHPLAVAFAARSALCALPFLAKPEDRAFLGFWHEHIRDRHLLAVLRAVQYAHGYSALGGGGRAIGAVVDACNAAVVDACNAADAAATATAYAAVAAAHAAYADDADAAAAAYYAAAAANAYARKVIYLALLNDAGELTTETDVRAYITQPLPSAIEPQARLFIAWLEAYGSGFDWWAGWYRECLEGGPLDPELVARCLDMDIPEELLAQGPATVNAYLKTITRHEATRPLDRVRVIFIGYGQSGKTSLVRALHGEAVEAGQEDMTPGIEIRDWPVPETAIKAHCWDFGGQVMAHATHQFFLRERCVYVLVMEPRGEIDANQQAQYWLEHVRLFGGDSPVLLVGNKADRLTLHLDMNTLKEGYPNLVGFYPLSCTGYRDEYRQEFEVFRKALVRELREAGARQVLFTPRHFRVLEDLRSPERKGQSFLEKREFESLCDQHKVEARGDLNRDWLLDLLDKLGVVVHFPGLDWLGAYVLNPRWLTYGVYTLLYSEEARKAAGRLTQAEVIAILGRAECRDNLGNVLEFPSEKSRFILDAMQRFELCYALPGAAETYILPDLLPSDRPEDLDFDKNAALAFDFDFEALLPRHLMTGFIVRRHGEIWDQRVWQNGVRLSSLHWKAEALVQADHHRRRLSLWVAGPEAARYFTALHDEFMAMLDRMKMDRSRFSEWVALPGARYAPGTEPPRAKFRGVLAQEKAGLPKYYCEYGEFPFDEVLKIMPKDEREKQSRTINFYGPAAYNEAGTMNETIFGDKTVVMAQARELDGKLAGLHYDLDVQLEDAALRGPALRELEKVRDALKVIERGGAPEKRSALETLGRFADQVKAGSGGTVTALKTIKDGGEAVSWLMEKVPLIVAELARWLG